MCGRGWFIVFFQAEDGMRGAKESGGLGDVYMRQGCMWVHVGVLQAAYGCIWVHMGAYGCMWVHVGACGCTWVHMGAFGCMWAGAYTHMKMQTKRLVYMSVGSVRL